MSINTRKIEQLARGTYACVFLHVVVLTPAYMLALKQPHILWSIGRSVDRGVVIKPALVLGLLKFHLQKLRSIVTKKRG